MQDNNEKIEVYSQIYNETTKHYRHLLSFASGVVFTLNLLSAVTILSSIISKTYPIVPLIFFTFLGTVIMLSLLRDYNKNKKIWINNQIKLSSKKETI